MSCVDLTAPFCARNLDPVIERREVALQSDKTRYTGVVYNVSTSTMMGSYIDFPGHILETDDGLNGANADLADFTNIPAAVIHLDRAGQPGGVTAEDLEKACGGVPDTPAVIINALGSTGTFEVSPRSVYLTLDAVEWLKKTPCRLLVSDIYESTALEGVFLKLFEHGISTVCEPANLHKLPSGVVKLNVLFSKIAITQLPCALTAEF
ncbi:MAG: cyclase family protein [Lentisphaeria bacterium]|nr:cyclase family protein [Lentisphaeria bacterium]